jgi:hypothetical protein
VGKIALIFFIKGNFMKKALAFFFVFVSSIIANETSSVSRHTISYRDMTDVSYFTDEYIVHSNLWGARAMGQNVPPFKFNLTQSDSVLPSNISYDWTILDDLEMPIFPYMGYGDRLWAKKSSSTTLKLPIQIKDIESCDIYCELEIDEKSFAVSKGNLAYDVWFARDAINNDDEKRIEIMLWFNRNDQYPVGGNNHQGVYSFFGIQWDLFVGNLRPKKEGGQGTVVCTFIAQSPAYKGMVDFMKPMEIIKRKGLLKESDYLGAFELGNEVYRGNGSTNIKAFHVDIQPKGLPKDKLRLNWSFHHEAFSKKLFKGNEGFSTAMTNLDEVDKRSVALRFRPLDNQKKQVLFKEGGEKNGVSIFIDQGKIYYASWDKVDGKLNKAFLSSPIEIDEVGSKAKYYNAIFTLDKENQEMKAYLNGVLVGTSEFYGLKPRRGRTSIAYADGHAKLVYPEGVQQHTAFFHGILDDVLIYDCVLTGNQVRLIK